MTTPSELAREVMALDHHQRQTVLLMLASSDPDAVRHALDVERQTRPGDRSPALAQSDRYVTVDFADIEAVDR